ncbi:MULTISPECIES: DUF4280 domain-containing protein [unclassified Caballeronia]|uniref:DUF4280 domain-containing protein n=1 Tax=unclassified Caballeronia TaxID=2646786 RepID=UPI002860EE22|nr:MULTISPECIES: DUF4280 domain-containing protein [unclassified Caballeronia]MDR5815329.1 DUF4280 domain-containing protein [Caballeronia sp. LZ033]MDR5821687.1 DUF4280 domain-containing protein [Caballeronia sp. LZ043]MDR5880059.1 DUF4280 domain-containing protein [Caballeronia sp. LZ032]
MGIQVTAGATLQCSFGAAPGTLQVLPVNRVLCGTPAATIMDNVPMVNVLPFGTCTSMANPVVAAATAAALGALTPMPCVPATTAPWAPGSPTVLIGSLPALQNSSKLMCMWAGVIQVVAPAQVTTMTA